MNILINGVAQLHNVLNTTNPTDTLTEEELDTMSKKIIAKAKSKTTPAKAAAPKSLFAATMAAVEDTNQEGLVKALAGHLTTVNQQRSLKVTTPANLLAAYMANLEAAIDSGEIKTAADLSTFQVNSAERSRLRNDFGLSI
jgi:hypothetical protein